MNELQPREAWFFLITSLYSLRPVVASAAKMLRRQPPKFQNVTLVRRREHFQGFLTIFLVAQLPPKRVVLVSTQEFTRFLATVSSQRRPATRSEVSF